MSKVSFISFCIENYADYIKKPSSYVYKLFKEQGLLDLLRNDYADLHGMGVEYMIDFCRKYLDGGKV